MNFTFAWMPNLKFISWTDSTNASCHFCQDKLCDNFFLTFIFIYFQHKDNIVIVPEPLDLVNISQSRCSPSDLLRMRDILATKLETNPGAGPEQPITALTMLRYVNFLIQEMIISYILSISILFEDFFLSCF